MLLLLSSFVRSFVCSFVRPSVRSFVRLFVCSFVRERLPVPLVHLCFLLFVEVDSAVHLHCAHSEGWQTRKCKVFCKMMDLSVGICVEVCLQWPNNMFCACGRLN